MRITTLSLIYIAMFIVFSGAIAYGQTGYSGHILVDNMRAYEKTSIDDFNEREQASLYMGYVSGVFDATSHYINIPKNITHGQAWDIVTKFLNKHPERLNEPAAKLIVEALLEAFPK